MSITESDRAFWAFQPPQRPLEKTPSDSWVWQPLDALVLAGFREHNVQPSPEAAPTVLLRRLTFDLTGLPPTPDELAACVSDGRTIFHGGGSSARLPAFRRAHGEPLAAARALRRGPGAPGRQRHQVLLSERLPIPRVGHRRLQSRPAVRPFLKLQLAADAAGHRRGRLGGARLPRPRPEVLQPRPARGDGG